jgi:glycosyltransferase involved in cell wall biosynthesis
MEPLVSILIPAYNAEAWISDTICSALTQTWSRKEIIIVDDGSRDQTLAVAKGFESATVKVVGQSNAGASATRNKAYSLSQGDYIQWLDADDLLECDKIAKQLDVARQHGSKRTLLSSAWGRFMYRPRKAKFVPTNLWCDLSPIEWALRHLEQSVFIQPAAWLVTRELAEAAGPWDARLSNNDDGEYACRTVLASDSVRFVPEAKTYYRTLIGSSLSNNRSARKLESLCLSIELIVGRIWDREKTPRARAASLKYLGDVLIFFYPERPDLVQRARTLAATLGGELPAPKLPFTYDWVDRLFGLSTAKRAQAHYNKFKWTLIRTWDQMLASLEKENLPTQACRKS